MGTKPEVTKPKLWSNTEAKAEALNFWKHEAEAKAKAEAFSKHEAEAEAQVLPSYHKADCKKLCVSGNLTDPTKRGPTLNIFFK